MPLPNFVAQTDIFFTWLDATNNLTSHVDNTSAYLLVAQNATPRTSTGNIALSGTFTLGTTVLNTSAIVANGNFLTTLNASAITTGTLPIGQLDGNVILTTSTTGINASALSTGIVPLGRLTSASASANGVVDTTTQTFAGDKTFTGVLAGTGGSKLVVQNGVDGTSTRGIFLWTATDSNWGLYLSQAGAGKSLANGAATSSLDARSGWHVRSRTGSLTSEGFLWENQSEVALMSLTGDTGNLYLKGNVYVGNSSTQEVLHTGTTTGINASALSTGTVPVARLDSSVILTTSTTGINASALSTGIVPSARLTSASGTANGIVDTTTQTFAGNKTFNNDVTIAGTLTLIGQGLTLNTNNIIVQDSLIQLAANNTTSDALDIGLYGNYNSDGGAHEHTGLFRDASDGLWKLFVGLQDAPTNTTINIAGTGYAVGTLQTYLTSGGMVSNSTAFAVTANSSYTGTLTVNSVTAQTLTGDLTGTASNATNLNSQPGSFYTNASNLNTGTVPVGRLDSSVLLTTSTTGINASALSVGTVPVARLDSSVLLTTSTTGINASALSTGTVPVARLDSSVLLTTSTAGINASALSTGTVPVGRLDSSVLLTTSTTGINASALSTGTVPVARLSSANTTTAGVVDTTTQSFAGNKTFTNDVTVSGTLTGSLTGTASNATNLNSQPGSFYTNASNLNTGTVPVARLDSSVLLTTSTTGINASALSVGTVPVARLDSSVILTTATTGINASALSTGTVPLARLTSASASANGVVDTTTQTFAGVKTFQNTVILQSALTANSGNGSAGQVLTSSGTGVYWANASAGAAANTAGGTGALQFYNGTTLGADANLAFLTNTLTVNGGMTVAANVNVDSGTLFVDATNDSVGMGTVTLGTESNLYLGARGADEGGQITLQRGTSRTTAFSWDNYQDTLRVLVGNNTVSNASVFTITASGNTSISGTLGVTGTLSALGQLSVTGNATFDTNTLFVDATNDRVGIGNTAPASKLVVSDAGNYQIGITGTSTTAYTQLYLNGTNRAYGVGVGGGSETAYGVPDEFFIFDHTAAAMRLVLDTNGNVGLGNTSPAHKLRVEGTTSISGALNALSTLAVTGATTLSSTLGVTGVATFSANANFDNGVLFVDGTNNRVGVNNTAPSQAFRVDGTTSISGNVAIGTTNTSAFALLVEGSFAATTKEFNIAHPTRPGKRLRYGVLESPYHGVRLTGRAELTGTEVEVPLPDYLSALCTDVGSQVQLTNHGHDKVLWVDRINLARNCFVVRMRRRWWDRTTYAFYWAFTGIRQDVEPLDVEPE